MSTYLQARSDRGFKVHAVSDKGTRVGMHGMLTWAKPVCGKVKGTDGWGMPTMHLQFKGRPVDDNPLPFSKDRNDFYAAANICGACCEALAKLEVSA